MVVSRVVSRVRRQLPPRTATARPRTAHRIRTPPPRRPGDPTPTLIAVNLVVVGAAIVRGDALLAAQRSYPAELAGLWELPGGRVEPGESEADALRRECAEELGAEIRVLGRVGPEVPLSASKVLRIHHAELVHGSSEPHAREHQRLRWLTPTQLSEVPWLPADEVLLPDLRALLMADDGELGAGRP